MYANYPKYSVRNILIDNSNWKKYKLFHRAELKDYQIKEVDSMLLCNDPSQGFMVVHCDNCKEDYTVHFSCNSRICPRCGNKYMKIWVEKISERMHDVDYSHIVFTLPRDIWNLIEGNWDCISELYKATFRVLQETMSQSAKQKITPGMIEAGHTFGKDIKWNVHFHSICTEGGITKNRFWKRVYYLPYKIMRIKWKQYSLKIISKHIGISFEEQITLESVYCQYKDGFDIRRIKGKMKKKELAGYIARYIRHPAISNRRIIDYNTKEVTIDCRGRNEIFSIDSFIGRLVKHIPPKGFQVVRHYGIYSKRKYEKKSIPKDKQEIIQNYFGKKFIKCPRCGKNAEIIFFYKPDYREKPPPKKMFGEKISDWIS